MATRFLVVLCFFLINLAFVFGIVSEQESDPNVPDSSDMNVIDDYIKSRSELDKQDKPKQVHKTESGEACECVKYYHCKVDDNTTNPDGKIKGVLPEGNHTNTDAESGTEGNSTVILGIVDIRAVPLRNRNDTNSSNSEDPSGCPHYFDVCCIAKNIMEAQKNDSHPPQQNGKYVHTQCGKRNENGVGFKTTGGTEGEAQFGEFPWTAAVVQLVPNDENVLVNKYVGGGSLIHPKAVLTVAHNVIGKNRSTLVARLGEWDTQTTDEPFPSQDRKVSKVIIHERFLKTTLNNDVALLILDEEARFAPNVDTICLPPVAKKTFDFDGKIGYSAGWGKNQFGAEGKFSDILKKVAVPVVSHEVCEKRLLKSERLPNFRLDKSFTCAGGAESGEDTCMGDGGAALVTSLSVDDQTRYVQIGAVSWGLGCKSTVFPSVYTDIQFLTPWILKKMEDEGLSTEYCSFSK